ncbi:MAG: dTDP-glucose 4,6-dehydratase [Methanolinea sp.]|nr:dTDP-glucose 4,6-dehydratase [Methanolinea sp.]
MRTLLVTGVAGFIGSNYVYQHLLDYPSDRILGLDALTYAGNLENLASIQEDARSRFRFVRADITDRSATGAIFREHQIDGLIHFAAESHVDRSIQDPGTFLRTNVLGTGVLLDMAREYLGKGRFLQISTDEVYGSLGRDGRFSETTPLDPHSPYSASKAAADLLVKAYHDTYGLPVLITRCSNNYGPFQFPEKLIPLIIRNALAHQPLPVYGDGRQVRDWLYVNDHCRAIDLVFEKGDPGEIYNIGGNNEWENIEIVKLIVSLLRKETGDVAIDESLIRHVQDRPGHDRRYAIDATKIRTRLGWKPETSFPDGIRSTIRWYLDHQEWVGHVVSGEYQSFYEDNYRNRLG